MKIISLKPLLASLVAMLASVSLSAHDVEIDGIYYNLNSEKKTATVTYEGDSYSTYTGEYSGSVMIPSSITIEGIMYSVTSIGNDAFRGCSGLTSITIPEGVTTIEFEAFSGCSGLTSITIPENVTSIGNSAFYKCSGLTALTIPESVTSIGISAFYYCSGLTSITIPENVTSIGSSAFYNCSGLTSITIPESVTSIGSSAFYYCSGLTSLTIPEGVTSIGYDAFKNCYRLTSVTIPESVTSIGRCAFEGCKGSLILYCDIPDRGAADSPFRGSKFTNVIMNGKYIGNYAFNDCSTIESVKISENVTSIGDGAFYGCSGLTSISLPESVTSIGKGAFSGCSGLTETVYTSKLFARLPVSFQGEYVIPSTFETICGEAFSGCSGLTSITIPENVTNIGDYAFRGCTGIKTVNALSATPPTAASNSFDGVYNTAFLYVPLGCEEVYGTAEGWSSFAKLREKDFGTKDCLLTLKGFNGGSVALKCKTRSTYAFQIHAEEGWKVSSMTFNGADATASIAADGSYTTPSLTDDSELSVVFEEEGSAVGEISTEDVLRVSASGEVLSIQNEGEAMQATIFTTDGKQVKAIEAKRGTTQVRLAEGQVYLVKIGGRTFKVAM